MLERYLLVRGVRGHLVANPHADPSARRFLGKMPNGPHWEAGPPGKDGKPEWPESVPVDEVVKDDVDKSIRKAAKAGRGGIVIVGECLAHDHDSARKQLVKPAAAPSKKGE